MAVILSIGFDPKWHGKFHLEVFDPEDAARVQAGRDYFEAEDLAHIKKSLAETGKLDEVGFRLQERPWRAEFLPQKLRFAKGKKLPDFAGHVAGGNNECATSLLVSPRLKSLIEAHQTDADGWNFFPVDIYQKDGTLYDTYYVWWVHRVVDALDEDSPGIRSVLNSDVSLKNYPDASGNYEGPRSPERQRVRKSVIANLSAWIDYRFFPSHKIFVSDALYQAMVDQGMTNFEPDSVWGEV